MTNNTETKGRKPDLIAFVVNKDGFYTRVGAAWKHTKGDGYGVQLDAFPAGTNKLVFFPPKVKPEGKPLEDE